MTRRNPVVPRMRHIAKNYSPGITYLVAKAWLEAVGADTEAGDLEQELIDDRSFYQDIDDPSAMIVTYLSAVAHGERHGGGEAGARPLTHTRFDRYLPWLAKTLNDIYKPVLRKLRTDLAQIEDYHWEELRNWAGHEGGRFKTVPLIMLFREPPYNVHSTTHRLPLAPWRRQYITAESESDALVNRFRAIVDWAEESGVDLNTLDHYQIIEAAEQAAAQRVKENVAQGEVVFDLPDGWTVQELSTKQQFDDESEAMQNCLDTYDPAQVGKRFRIYSLRDPQGKPHATMEWDVPGARVEQLRGKQNDAPDAVYLQRMIEFRLGYLDPEQVGDEFLPKPPPGVGERLEMLTRSQWKKLAVRDDRLDETVELADAGFDSPIIAVFESSNPDTIGPMVVVFLDGTIRALDDVQYTIQDVAPSVGSGPSLTTVDVDDNWFGGDGLGGVGWEVWKAAGGQLRSSYLQNGDEMSEWIHRAGAGDLWRQTFTPTKANPRSQLSRHATLKRRLMR